MKNEEARRMLSEDNLKKAEEQVHEGLEDGTITVEEAQAVKAVIETLRGKDNFAAIAVIATVFNVLNVKECGAIMKVWKRLLSIKCLREC